MMNVIMKRMVCSCLLFLSTIVPVISYAQSSNTPVDVVFCIDLSASTNGVLDRFRDHLWDYVHLAAQCSPSADFRIGFVAFSRPSYKRENNFVKVVQDLTSDFETLSHELLQIKSTIEKGDQFVGAALTICSQKISWSVDANALKVVFLVGNGMANTGVVNYEKAAYELAGKGVIINTVYCLESASAIEKRGWEEIAGIGNGKFSVTEIKNRIYESDHGFNLDKFHALNRKFNNTYLFYGKKGSSYWRMQNREDDYMYTYNTTGYRYRAQFKISDRYQQKNADWDLIDLQYKNPELIAHQDKFTMPDTMKNMSKEDIRAFVIFNKYNRKLLTKKISKMIDDQEEKDKAEGREAEKTTKTFDLITVRLLKELMKIKGYEFTENSYEHQKN